MIPVSLPGGNFYVTMALSLVCLATLLTWAASLARSRDARWWLSDHRKLDSVLMAMLAVGGAVFPYQQLSHWLDSQRLARADAALRTVLAQARNLAGVAMPAGTELRLRKQDDPESFEEARFPVPTPVAGVKAERLLRHFDAAGTSASWSLALAGNETIAGWLCSRGHKAEFRLRGSQPEFSSCHLASGNRIEEQNLPAGTWLTATPEGWLLRTGGSESLRVEGLDLLKADVRLDGGHRRTHFEGLLAHESVLGDVTYPAGTRVSAAGAKVPGAQPGDLLLSPSRGRSAHRAGGSEIAAGKSVLQAPDGTVRSVLSNREAGVLDVASVRLGP
ncbi:hypothetical protein RVU96_00255 [Bordetella avium]|uniref:hypothetical protein n=1 Tax=Bordetella avium TaxID=521 RepID=UPI000E0B8636|nr:hypothetical protein [Bordetella avium]RIQ15456.1 hypothetical protein D0432_04885 [Bordetella avium]RIQ56260.1 hypothetical protein D0844_05005 [Bordetella avium]RIQ65048.1 hypothetical protein D0842_05000 [Bordetella avium]RIQ65611.1 hypothetical protein D0840_05000 [Bordetella avium]RIQ82800.1 hypothetical protein D0835_05220 [Bordetella avium]